jgi:hypothetical protein
MKKQLCALLFAGSITLLQAQTLTLHEAIESTLAHHPDVKNFMLRV